MKPLFLFLLLLLIQHLSAQPYSKTFELRQFTDDKQANGITSFKGGREWMDTEQRIKFLKKYSDMASTFFNNHEIDKSIVSKSEIDSLLANIKPKPTTTVRNTLKLKKWKAYGYRDGTDAEKQINLKRWKAFNNVVINNGKLLLNDADINYKISLLNWRFKMELSVRVTSDDSFQLVLSEGSTPAIIFGLKHNKLIYGSDKELKETGIDANEQFTKLTIEADFSQKKFNLYFDGKRLKYYIPFYNTTANAIDNISLKSVGNVEIEDIFIFNHIQTNEVRYPYVSKVILDEDFELKEPVGGWTKFKFDDSNWKEVSLPSAHGGLREKDEYYYLRNKTKIDDFERATLKIETIDPGGEIWVNGEIAAVIKNRHPVEVDVTKFVKKEAENIVAIKVYPYKLSNKMPHTPTDPYIGWFLGRVNLELSNKCKIKDVFVHTKSIENTAIQSHKIKIQYPSHEYFEGSLSIKYSPWYPEETDVVATINKEIKISPQIDNEYQIECPIKSPKLWEYGNPNLYQVKVELYDKYEKLIDDFVTTTGIRTISQGEGNFYINNQPEILKGAQIMGFRAPIETISKYNRCAPWETIIEEMLMVKKMGANMLRIHVHAEKDTVDGINDPRYAELADQMGIMLIWQTAGWIREGEAWNVDFTGYPKYMEQVYNHPSIVMWEASNHPNKFKKHDVTATNYFVKRIFNTIAQIDTSRLISPTTFWQHTHFANYDGTVDYKGNKITPTPEFNSSLVTRGSQDAYAGYGHNWTQILNIPNAWAGSCLEAREKAYFNFEHEESTGQPNWNLCKGKPWYLLQSYEWIYDEGSIGRKLTTNEWKVSQAWQAFSAWESMKMQLLNGYDGFSWCCLRGGANMGTYKKPLIDNLGHPKLAYYTNKMIYQNTWAGSNNADIIYGPDDLLTPVIHHIGQNKLVNLEIKLSDNSGNIIEKKEFENIYLPEGRQTIELDGFRFKGIKNGIYSIVYELNELQTQN